MVVVGLIAILGSIVVVGIQRASASFALRQAGTVTASEIRRAQTGATSDGVNYVVEFDVGAPGAINVYRPGVVTNSVVAVISDGADTRVVTITGTAAGRVATEVLSLDSNTEVVGTQTFDWVIQADVSSDNSARTVTVRQGAGGPALVTIPVNQLAATLPWTRMRSVSGEAWPSTVGIDATGTTFGACGGALPGNGANECATFQPLGYPSAGGNVLLCDSRRIPLRVAIADATGRVRLEHAGTCP
jgi:hypothetical protein